MPQLTEKQRQAIIETWKIPSANPIDSAEGILYTFFEKYPDNQQKFYKFKNVPLKDLKGTPAFRAHASRVMNTFNATVDCLSCPGGWEEIPNIWREIGESHNKRKISKKSFMELRDVVVSILIAVCKLNQEQQEAWTVLLDYVYEAAMEKVAQ
uniref:CSON006171 protein n=1 Tax=Culicoides sonorensis TaxID=179676 RepID=A0A336LW33_CULSO